MHLGNLRFWCFSLPRLDGKICYKQLYLNLPSKMGNNIFFAKFMEIQLPVINGKFAFSHNYAIIYHPTQAKVFSVKSSNSKFCGKFWLSFDSDNLPLHLGNLRFWCFSLPRLDGKICYKQLYLNLPSKMGKENFFPNWMVNYYKFE